MNELQEYDPEYDRMNIIEVRERVLDQLQRNYVHDNILEEEFEKRIDQAHEAKTKKELLALVADLPVLRDEETRSDVSEYSGSIAINRGQVRESDTLIAILSGSDRKGIWRPARRTNIVAFMGGAELDFSRAELPPGVTEVNVFAMMGGVDVFVPPELNVEVHGFPIMGGIDNKSEGTRDGSGPVLKIKAFVLMGGIDIKVKRR